MYSSLSRSSPESSGDKRDVMLVGRGFEVKKMAKFRAHQAQGLMASSLILKKEKKGKREKGGKRKRKEERGGDCAILLFTRTRWHAPHHTCGMCANAEPRMNYCRCRLRSFLWTLKENDACTENRNSVPVQIAHRTSWPPRCDGSRWHESRP